MADDTATTDAAPADEPVEAVQPDELRDDLVARMGEVLGDALLE